MRGAAIQLLVRCMLCGNGEMQLKGGHPATKMRRQLPQGLLCLGYGHFSCVVSIFQILSFAEYRLFFSSISLKREYSKLLFVVHGQFEFISRGGYFDSLDSLLTLVLVNEQKDCEISLVYWPYKIS